MLLRSLHGLASPFVEAIATFNPPVASAVGSLFAILATLAAGSMSQKKGVCFVQPGRLRRRGRALRITAVTDLGQP